MLTFAVMLIVAALMGGLTARLKEAGRRLRERERQVESLTPSAANWLVTTQATGVISIARSHLGRAVRGEADLVLATAAQPEPFQGGFDALVVPVWPDRPEGGVAILRLNPDTRVVSEEERRTVRLLLDQVAVALERIGGTAGTGVFDVFLIPTPPVLSQPRRSSRVTSTTLRLEAHRVGPHLRRHHHRVLRPDAPVRPRLRGPGPAGRGGAAVSAMSLVGLVLSIATIVYLVYVMLRPERF